MARYIEIADELRERLRRNEFEVGSRFPGISELKATYDASLSTIRAAEAILRDEGLLRIVHGDGVYVTALPAPAGGADLLHLVRTAKTALAQLEAALTAPRPV